MRRSIRRLVLVAAALATISCDRVTKHVAVTTLAGTEGRSYLGDMVRLGYTENPGGFLSLGASLPPGARSVLFTAITGAMLVVVTVLAVRRGMQSWPALGVTLFVAGGASNWIDRILRGFVVDFLNVGIGPVRTGVFNVADMAIMFGSGILVLGEWSAIRRLTDGGR
jgi:signal peptidase II